MELTLIGHEDRYAVEQLQMSLFGPNREGKMVSSLHRGKTWLTAVTTITLDGKTSRGLRRMKAAEETVRLRRQILQQSCYRAALPHLPAIPAWARWPVYDPPRSPRNICWKAERFSLPTGF